ncbi:MAG TPA: YihY/virulence factor BrkB family protein [Candidatus Acidoferrales bacterium]|nr:YihY/virulence factor BrkB family protein [Candidatus Acidoferrales bacterium]
MTGMLERLGLAFGRVFPACVTLGQAVAFNMFLAFFPLLLFGLGVLSAIAPFESAVRDLPERLRTIVPPGSEQVVLDYFVRPHAHAWRWTVLGLGGLLVAGSQVLMGLMQGFWIVENAEKPSAYFRLQLRALAALCITIAPWLAFEGLTVFARPARHWIVEQFGFSVWVTGLFAAVYHGLTLVLAMIVVVIVYRIGQPAMRAFADVAPGAMVATVLWWVVDIVFGFYVRYMPYNAVYGSVAAAIGLLLWMYLTAMVLFVGAAYNAVSREVDIAKQDYRVLTPW